MVKGLVLQCHSSSLGQKREDSKKVFPGIYGATVDTVYSSHQINNKELAKSEVGNKAAYSDS